MSVPLRPQRPGSDPHGKAGAIGRPEEDLLRERLDLGVSSRAFTGETHQGVTTVHDGDIAFVPTLKWCRRNKVPDEREVRNDDVGPKTLNLLRNVDRCVSVEDGVGVCVRPSDVDQWTRDTGCWC
jgi:hypothetical protein